MNKLTIVEIIDQRRWVSHTVFAALSLVIVVFVSLNTGMTETFTGLLRFFVILFVQLETFIFIASRIFTELPVGLTRKQFTRILLVRFLIFILICFIAAFLIFITSRILLANPERQSLKVVWQNVMQNEIANWMKSTIRGLSLGAVIFVVIQWQDALKREQQLREENLIFQNQTLKNQVNPHFLFNSLNTLSALINSDPETAEKFTIRLASIYRYILENNIKDQVDLEKEISFIEDYFYLHRVRDEGKIEMKVSIADAGKYKILPVSLQLLVENAINHNMSSTEHPLKIEVFLENENIVVKNNLQKLSSSLKTTKTGLKNLSQRVKIVTGKSITIEENNEFFSVKIPLIQ
jgi:two-component system, LytTR family, sensor kinase